MVAAVKGYRLILVMPDSMSIERRRLMLAYGASFDLTPRFALGFEAINLTEEGVQTYGRDRMNTWYLAEGSARYLVGARYRF